MNNKIHRMALSAMIAAIYFGLSFVEQGFASGLIQCRLSEALTILPLFFPEAIIGVTIGCLIFNLSTGLLLDVILGTLATLISSLLTYFIGKLILNKYLKFVIGAIFPVVINALIVPIILMIEYSVEEAYFLIAIKIFIGQLIAVYGLGFLVYITMDKIFSLNIINREWLMVFFHIKCNLEYTKISTHHLTVLKIVVY